MKSQVQQDLVIISSYPPYGTIHGDKVAGVASYTKNTLLSLQKLYKNVSITVLAEAFNGNKDYYEEDGMRVLRLWRPNTLLLFPVLLKELLTSQRGKKKVIIELEFAMFGGLIYLLPLPLFLVALKLLRKEVTFISHQVAPDLNELSGHLNLTPNSFKAYLLNLGIKSYYALVVRLSNKTIVFEDVLKDKLQKVSKNKNVVVIPHGVQSFTNLPSKVQARKRLGLPQDKFLVVSFGFISWYKGSDWLINTFKKITKAKNNKNAMLVLAGGPNTNHIQKDFYSKYMKNIKRSIKNSDILITGFVAEKDISLYYLSADVIVFPYRTLMSASGPLSLAFSFGKPVMLSDKLIGLANTKDIKKTLSKLKLKKDMLFYKGEDGFGKSLLNLQKNATVRNDLATFSKLLATQRNWNNIAKQYYAQLA